MRKHKYDVFHPAEFHAILDGISNGVSIDYTGPRSVDRDAPNLPVDPGDAPKVDAVIADDVATLKKAGPYDTKPFEFFSVSPVGAVPKKGSTKVRMIHHLSYPDKPRKGELESVNAHITEVDMKISDVKQAIVRIVELGRGSFLIKMDVEAAYKQIPVRRADWPLLGFKWQGKYYYERVLPFGLTSSCRLWELYASALHWILRKEVDMDGMVHYVDDFLFLVRPGDETRAARCVAAVQAVCERLGIPMAPKKTEGPCFKLVFLGIQLDTDKMEASLTQARLDEIRLACGQLAESEKASAKDLQRLIGLLNFACFVIEPGRVFLKRANNTLKLWQALNRADGRGDGVLRTIPHIVKDDCRWWQQCVDRWNGKSFFYEARWTPQSEMQLFTDACNSGMGARWGDRWFEARWSPAQLETATRRTRISMPFLELTALVSAALTWGREWRGRRITLMCDSKGVVDALRDTSLRDPHMCELLRELTMCAIECNFVWQCIHVPGVSNVCADDLSRDGAQPGVIAKHGLRPHPDPAVLPRACSRA